MGGRGLAKLATAGSCLRQPERRRPRAGARQGLPSSLAHTRSAQPKEGIEKTEPEDDGEAVEDDGAHRPERPEAGGADGDHVGIPSEERGAPPIPHAIYERWVKSATPQRAAKFGSCLPEDANRSQARPGESFALGASHFADDAGPTPIAPTGIHRQSHDYI